MSPVGQRLADERRKQGKTLADVEASTKIMHRLLKALEAERWDEMPPAAYAKGYVQSYATYLGLDPKPYVAEFLKDIGQHRDRPEIGRIPGRTVVPKPEHAHAMPRVSWRFLVVALIALIVVSWAVASLTDRTAEPPPIPPETTTPTVETNAVAPGIAGTETPEPEDPDSEAGPATSPEAAFTLRVAVDAGTPSWLRVTVDGLVAYEGTAPGGTVKEWVVTETATVRAGKPASVTVTRDGDPVALRSTQGIGEVTISADE